MEVVELKDHPWFIGVQYHPELKSTVLNPHPLFVAFVKAAQERTGTLGISAEDLVCTLSTFTATTIADFIRANFPADIKLFASGGGARNIFVMDSLMRALPDVDIHDTAALGIDPDAKEAILFALLGNEALCGEPMKIGDNPGVLMGKFSFAE